MKLQQFRVEGFRCLRSTQWIPLRKLTIFTGQNDGGKTSALDALNVFLDRRARVEDNDFTVTEENNRYDRIIIEAILELSSREQDQLDWDADTIYVKHIRSNDRTSKYLFKTKVHPDPSLQRDLNSLTIDELKEIAERYNISLTTRRSKEPIIRDIKQWLGAQRLEEGFLDLPTNYIEKFPSIKIFRSAKTLDPENEVYQTLSVSFSTKIQTDRYAGKLTEIQNEIEKELKNDLEDFEEIVKKYCPDISGIDIDPEFDFTRGFRASTLRLRRPDAPPIDLAKEGEGKKRRITLAVYEWREKILSEPEVPDDRQMIIAFDEPDTHLDYHSQRKILDIIKRISDKDRNSVITCTHSLNLIDRVPITDIVHFKKEKDGTSIETLQTEDPELVDMFLFEISDCMGLKNSVMLNERCFLIVEGETEMYSLPIIFKKMKGYSFQAGGIRLINGEGCGGVRSLAKFLNNNRRNVMFLVDRDAESNPNALFTAVKLRDEGFDVSKQVFFVGAREFEDTFSDETYERTANTYFAKYDGTQWSKEEFGAIRNSGDFSGELLTLLRQKTHKHITKPQIGLAVAKAMALNEVPEDIMCCLRKALELAV